MNIKNEIIDNLKQIGLSEDESRIYYELVRRGPLTHLELSRITGISRTKVYRLADQLELRSLVTQQADEKGSAIAASSHESLEIEMATQADKLEKQREAYTNLAPVLDRLSLEGAPPLNFTIRTYDGLVGFKQMLWNELKAQDELLAFGDGTLEDLVGSRNWAEKYRAKTVEQNYVIREIANKPVVPTDNRAFTKRIQARRISTSVLPLQHQMIIYNNTVSIYCWRDGQKIGLEIDNQAYADTMRAVFERYWAIAS